MKKQFATALIAIFAALLPTLRAQTVLADIRGNYAAAGPLTDTFGTGDWVYYASTTANPTSGDLTPLTFGGSRWGGSGANSTPAVSNAVIFGFDGADPSPTNSLAWHPSIPSDPEFTVLRWTAGAGEAGPITIQGTVSKVGEPGGMVAFYVFVNGSQVDFLSFAGGVSHNFNISATILGGQTVDFVLGNFDGDYNGDETLIKGTISAIPEPSAYAALFGVIALGAAGVREHRRRRQLAA